MKKLGDRAIHEIFAGRCGAVLLVAVVLGITLGTASTAWAQAPTFSKTFTPDTIGPGSTSALVFTITEIGGAAVDDLAFTDILPAGVMIATPAGATTTCTSATFSVSAPAGGGTIELTGGEVGAGSSCTVSVNVTSSTSGTHMNTSGDLTSSAGNSGAATDDLVVVIDRPGFTKSFSPASIPLGGTSTLTFTIDNTLNEGGGVEDLVFDDNLPGGIEIANPSNASTTCNNVPGTLTAVPGSNVISLFINGAPFSGAYALDPAATCTVTVDVDGVGVGQLDNVTSDLIIELGSGGPDVTAGFATDTLTVTVDNLALIKKFTNDPTPPGGNVTLEFTIQNLDRDNSATSLAFTDNLGDVGGALIGLMATGLPQNNVCGAGSSLTGTTSLMFSGGNLAPQTSCTFSVMVLVPGPATPGAYVNTTSTITGDVGGVPDVGGAASDTLFVVAAPVLTKTFLDESTLLPNPVVGAGGDVVMRFGITNTSSVSGASDIAFIDELTTFLPFPVSVVLPGSACGGSVALVFLDVDRQGIELTGGSLAASASCTFDVTLTVPTGVSSGTYVNTTEAITATVSAAPVTGNTATDSFLVVEGPTLRKEFTDDPVSPGGTATLEFTLMHDSLAPASATGIGFTDSLTAALAGLAAVGLPASNVCGAGSTLTGTTDLTLTGGTLAAGTSCTFSVNAQVPAAALPGTYTNTTSIVTSTVGGTSVTNNVAQGDLVISGLTFSKSFTDDPVIPGDTVTLEFTLNNTTLATSATGLVFLDDLSAVLPGLASVSAVQNDVCGVGSQISGTNTLTFTGGNLAPSTSCTFSVTLDVLAGAADGTYGNTTSNLFGDFGGSAVVIPPAVDSLTVSSDLLVLSKSFLNDPVGPGDPVNLEFTLTNQGTASATGIAFTDDLDGALSGLAATSLPPADFCGLGSAITGTTFLAFTGGNLAAGGSCTFTIPLLVPAVAANGTFTNTTSSVTGTVGALVATGSPANDDLVIAAVSFTKSFDGATFAGGNPVLTFTLLNLSATDTMSLLAFSDDLDSVLAGLTATGLPANDVCGIGSTLTGTSILALSNGELGPGATCTFNVTLQVPASATGGGTFANTTSPLDAAGINVAEPATANLSVVPVPGFSKAFSPNNIVPAGVSTLTFNIDNTGSALPATGLTFTDNLPTGVTIAAPSNESTTCTGGTLNAVAGTGVFGYTGGSVAAGASCTAQVDVTTFTPGSALNVSGALTSSLGSSGTASATLTVGALVCAPILMPASASFPALGGSSSFALGTSAACAWTAVSSDPAVTITSAAAGMGNATIAYDVAANLSATPRAFMVDVAFAATGESASHAIDQAEACSFTFEPASARVSEGDSRGNVAVLTNGVDCTWTATSHAPWLLVEGIINASHDGPGGTGDGSVAYRVLENNSADPRTATLTIGGRGFPVTQEAGICTYAIAPMVAVFGLVEGSITVSVDAGIGCTWTATSTDAWIDSADTGTGSGIATVGVHRNTSEADRSGMVTIADQALAVVQSTADDGAFALVPLAVGFPGTSGNGQVHVVAPSSEDWEAVPSVGWITITAPGSGAGTGTVGYTVAPNITASTRSGQIDIGGQTLTVVQAAAGASSVQVWIGDDAPDDGPDDTPTRQSPTLRPPALRPPGHEAGNGGSRR